jgi:hypothetical protein
MGGTSDWEKACDHIMPNVCRPAPVNTPRTRTKSKPAVPPQRQSLIEERPRAIHAKPKIALRIGVFFDGTGNNAANTALGLACGAQHPINPEDRDASCKPYMSDPDSSYGCDITNVKKLNNLYFAPEGLQGAGINRTALRKVYVDGIGTSAGEKDSLIGAGTGRGDTGVVGRVQHAFQLINGVVDRVILENSECEITSLTFDTFGFSRGAAAARHFANEVALGNRGLLKSVLETNVEGFSANFLDFYKSDINMGFIGLFDTVASIAGWTNFGRIQSSVAPGVHLYLPRHLFADVVHLVARDEHRANFPLSRVKPDHLEISVPGVHSDIGGGYFAEAQECVLVGAMQGLTVPKDTDVATTSIYRDAEKLKAQMVAKGWPATMLDIVTPAAKPLEVDSQDRMAVREQRVYAGLQLKRPVQGELSRVYLRVMHELAKQKGVRFDDVPETPDYQLTAELQSLCDRFVSGDYSVTPTEETLLKLRYIHTSAHWNNPLDDSGTHELGLFYINAPTVDGVRVQHPHVPD